jgi:hypothetical protein
MIYLGKYQFLGLIDPSLPLLRRFNPAEPVVEKSAILYRDYPFGIFKLFLKSEG